MSIVNTEPPLLIHIHVPKCAGTSINTFLGQQYPGRCLAYSNLADYLYFQSLPRDQRNNKYSSVFGHIFYGVHTEFDRNFTYFSVLRDPISRICSYFNYIHLTTDHPDHQLFKVRFPSISRISAKDIQTIPALRDNIFNYACWAYSGIRCESSTSWQQILQQIKIQIEKQHLVLGNVASIHRFLIDEKNIQDNQSLPVVNVTKSLFSESLDFELATKNTLNSQTKDLLESFNQYDQCIFDQWNTAK